MKYSSETHVLRLEQDQDASNPREDDNLAKMIFFGKHKGSGDNHDVQINGSFNGRGDFMTRGAQLVAKQMDAAVCLPVHWYSHSGESISTSFSYPYNCQWDSGTIGFVVVTKKDLRENFGVKRLNAKLIAKAVEIAVAEVETLGQYLSGDVYGFILEDLEGHQLDSCWGFYGSDIKENGVLDHVGKEYGEFVED